MQTKPSSSISSSRIRGKIRAVVAGVAFLLVFLVLEHAISQLLIPPERLKATFYPKTRWEEFYSEDENIDLLFLGSSHAYRGFDPALFERELGLNAFNIGSSSQNPVDSYYVLQEFLRHHEPKLVIYEVYWRIFEREEENFRSATLNYDFMQPSLVKLRYLFGAFTLQEMPSAMLYSVRYHENYKNPKYLHENAARVASSLLGRNQETEPSVSYQNAEYYKGQGYVANMNTISSRKLRNENEFAGYQGPQWTHKKLAYFEKLLKMCKERKVPLLLVTAPIPPTSLSMVKSYDEIHGAFVNIARKYGVEYIDYNLLNREKKAFRDFYFKDDDHLNHNGVLLFNGYLVADLRIRLGERSTVKPPTGPGQLWPVPLRTEDTN